MTPQEFQVAAARTACDQEAALARVCAFRPDGSPETRWLRALHGVAGAQKELGEVFDLLEKRLWFGRYGDERMTSAEAEVAFSRWAADEVGDALWYVALLCDALGLDLGAVMAANVAKLKNRYAGGWTAGASAAKADRATPYRMNESIALLLADGRRVEFGSVADGANEKLAAYKTHDWEAGPNPAGAPDRCRRCGTYSTLTTAALPCPKAVPDDAKSSSWTQPRRRTKADVQRGRHSPAGCCDRNADMRGCDCLKEAAPMEFPERVGDRWVCPNCGESHYRAAAGPCKCGYRLAPEVLDRLFPTPTGCGICRDPNCSDPNGKH